MKNSVLINGVSLSREQVEAAMADLNTPDTPTLLTPPFSPGDIICLDRLSDDWVYRVLGVTPGFMDLVRLNQNGTERYTTFDEKYHDGVVKSWIRLTDAEALPYKYPGAILRSQVRGGNYFQYAAGDSQFRGRVFLLLINEKLVVDASGSSWDNANHRRDAPVYLCTDFSGTRAK